MSPTGTHWLNFVYVNIGFIMIGIIMAYVISMKEIKSNWGKYRCNPMFMMFSDNMAGDFQSCVAKTQEVSINQMLQPYNDQLNDINAQISEQSAKTDQLQNDFAGFNFDTNVSFGGISNMIENGSVEMKKASYGLSDVMGKVSGIAATLLYVLDGNMKTMSSMWKGPPGQVMRSLGKLGHCFHPRTKVELMSGEMKAMEMMTPGLILKDGSKVVAVMQIDNLDFNEPLMLVGSDIYVTGSHLIQKEDVFIHVRDHPDAKEQSKVKSSWYACLITDTHKIQIGNYTFWDWEDYYYKGK